jgi:hypothetical protein
MDITEWLEMSGAGILFGMFPMWWWCSAMIINAAPFKGKIVPKWLIDFALYNPYIGFFASSQLWGKRYYQKILRSVAIVWVAVFILGMQYLALVDYAKGDLVVIVEENTSYPVFLLLTCIIPAYFLNKYLKHAKQKKIWNQNAPWDDE